MKFKSYIQTVGVMTCLGFTATSCNDFLEVEPLNEIVLEIGRAHV